MRYASVHSVVFISMFAASGSYALAQGPDAPCAPVCPPTLPVRAASGHWYPDAPTPTAWRDRTPSYAIGMAAGAINAKAMAHWWWSSDPYPPTDGCTDAPDDSYSTYLGTYPNWSGSPNGRPDQFDALLASLDDAYARGFRRIVLHMPAGTVNCQVLYQAANWWSMPAWRREWFERGNVAPMGVRGWLETHSDARLEIYAGWFINNPCSICSAGNFVVSCYNIGGSCNWLWPCTGYSASWVPQTTVFADMCQAWQNIQPWRDIGVRKYWLDAASGDAGPTSFEFREFAYNPHFQSTPAVTFGGEAYPTDALVGGRYPVRWAEFAYAPWVELLWWAERPYNNGLPCSNLNDPTAHQWTAPSDGEAAIWVPTYEGEWASLYCTEGATGWEAATRLESLYVRYACRGFTFWNGSGDPALNEPEYTQRIFGFGTLAKGADFNADGAITTADVTRFDAMYNQWQGYSAPGRVLTYYHGDLTGDHLVNSSDETLFYTLYLNPAQPPLEQGPLDWNPNTHWFPPCTVTPGGD